MKIKLFNGTTTLQDLRLVSGGLDPESGRLTFVVTGDDNKAGTLSFSTPDIAALRHGLDQIPDAERVEGVAV